MRVRVVVGICAVVAATAALAAEPMTGEEIKSAVSGRSFAWKSAKFKVNGTSVYSPNGAFLMTIGGKTQKGKWSIKGNKGCSQVGKEKETCSTWQRVDEKTFYLPAYQTTSVVKN